MPRKRRKRGERNPPRFTKVEILRYILDQESLEIEEPDLRDYLREKFGISEKKGISQHLHKLKDMGILEKEGRKGFPNVWRINVQEVWKIWTEFPELRDYLFQSGCLKNFFLESDLTPLVDIIAEKLKAKGENLTQEEKTELVNLINSREFRKIINLEEAREFETPFDYVFYLVGLACIYPKKSIVGLTNSNKKQLREYGLKMEKIHKMVGELSDQLKEKLSHLIPSYVRISLMVPISRYFFLARALYETNKKAHREDLTKKIMRLASDPTLRMKTLRELYPESLIKDLLIHLEY